MEEDDKNNMKARVKFSLPCMVTGTFGHVACGGASTSKWFLGQGCHLRAGLLACLAAPHHRSTLAAPVQICTWSLFKSKAFSDQVPFVTNCLCRGSSVVFMFSALTMVVTCKPTTVRVLTSHQSWGAGTTCTTVWKSWQDADGSYALFLPKLNRQNLT